MGETRKKDKKTYELAPNILILLPELELKVDSERRDQILQAQITRLDEKIEKELKKSESRK